MEWRKTTGTQTTQPAVLDLDSSPSTVYIRKNITKATVRDAEGVKVPVWKYDEAAISRAEYEKNEAIYSELVVMIEQQAANDSIYSDVLLQQADAQATLEEQDETLADILLTVQGV